MLSRIFYRCVDWNASDILRLQRLKSRIFYRCVDWNMMANIRFFSRSSRIFYRCVDWNVSKSRYAIAKGSRIFYRCVDWNHCLVVLLLWCKVASFTDAWIETIGLNFEEIKGKSHLLQMRGLKLSVKLISSIWDLSHLLQMRGLKQVLGSTYKLVRGRIFYRCVDWNTCISLGVRASVSRIFYRCVDWNMEGCCILCKSGVASFTDAWIET